MKLVLDSEFSRSSACASSQWPHRASPAGWVVWINPWALEFKVDATTTNASNYRNHGDYVSQMGGGSDASHSCIGMSIR